MRVWISCTVLGVVATGAAALAYGCGVSSFSACTDNGTCTGDGGLDASMTGDSTNPGDTGIGGDAGGDVVKPGEAGCPAPTTLECGGTCVDPTTVANCGTCGTKCEADSSTPVCADMKCSSGCMGSSPDNCSGTCTNTQTDPQHCGTCTNACSGPDSGSGVGTCTGGMCTVSCNAAAGTPLFCPGVGTCVDPTAPTSCGSCTLHCAGPMTDAGVATSNGKPTCGLSNDAGVSPDGGACGIQCNPTFHNCGSDCLSNTDDPAVDPCVVGTPGTGIFVSESMAAANGGNGTMASPYTTVTAGIGAAVATGGAKRVYVCIGTYNEQLSLTSADDGVVVYGGLDCSTGWNYVGNTQGPTLVATPTSIATPGTALTVTGPMTTGVTFEDMSFQSPNYSGEPGDSSVAVFATKNASLTLTRVNVTAGTGVTGSTPMPSYNTNWSFGSATTGAAPTFDAQGNSIGGLGGTNSCLLPPVTTSGGGKGGTYTAIGVMCSNGGEGTNSSGLDTQGEGQGGTTTAKCGSGGTGDPGTAATQVGAGATSAGSVGMSGWVAGGSGGPGGQGGPAYGGGGGGAACEPGFTYGGGGGGAGGCGGGPGLPGGPGGSSIGIASYQSAVALTASTVMTSTAGGGGTGGAGQDGQGGANGDSEISPHCGGGQGGQGGPGSGGGGGAGGSSIGIAWSAGTIVIDSTTITADQQTPYNNSKTTITTGAAGAQGPGGGPGSGPAGGATGSPGVAGSNDAIQKF